jgi:hypothetical protein
MALARVGQKVPSQNQDLKTLRCYAGVAERRVMSAWARTGRECTPRAHLAQVSERPAYPCDQDTWFELNEFEHGSTSTAFCCRNTVDNGVPVLCAVYRHCRLGMGHASSSPAACLQEKRLDLAGTGAVRRATATAPRIQQICVQARLPFSRRDPRASFSNRWCAQQSLRSGTASIEVTEREAERPVPCAHPKPLLQMVCSAQVRLSRSVWRHDYAFSRRNASAQQICAQARLRI